MNRCGGGPRPWVLSPRSRRRPGRERERGRKTSRKISVRVKKTGGQQAAVHRETLQEYTQTGRIHIVHSSSSDSLPLCFKLFVLGRPPRCDCTRLASSTKAFLSVKVGREANKYPRGFPSGGRGWLSCGHAPREDGRAVKPRFRTMFVEDGPVANGRRCRRCTRPLMECSLPPFEPKLMLRAGLFLPRPGETEAVLWVLPATSPPAFVLPPYRGAAVRVGSIFPRIASTLSASNKGLILTHLSSSLSRFELLF